MQNNRIASKEITDAQDWAAFVAEEVVKRFPDQELYTCAAGISPSGVIHFGNFRDVMTALSVAEALKDLGKNVRLLFSWDDFDRFRKVPKGMPEHLNLPLTDAILEQTDADLSAYIGTGVNDLPEDLKEVAIKACEKWFQVEYKQYEGCPLTSIPDPLVELDSYATRFEREFEQAMNLLDIDIEYRRQTGEFQAGTYADKMILALQKRELIAETLFGFMSEVSIERKGLVKADYISSFYPISVYSSFTGKDATEVLSFDGEHTIRYRCKITKQEEDVDLRTAKNVKLQWKVDWPMRWHHENVHFEPGGKDHATPGGSYDVSATLSEKVYGRPGPVFVGYDFIGISGRDGKMSGSAGNAISPGQLLEIYTPELLRWIYARTKPNRPFNLSFDSEIYRQYTELDRELGNEDAMPFRQLVGYGQIVNWDLEKLNALLEKTGESYSQDSIVHRIDCAKRWLETYNESEMFRLTKDPRADYYAELPQEIKDQLAELVTYLKESDCENLEEMTAKLYVIPKEDPSAAEPTPEDKKRQRAFFKAIYQLLFERNKGPRLATYFWAVAKEELLCRLSF